MLSTVKRPKAREWLLSQRGKDPEVDERFESLGINRALSSTLSMAEIIPTLPQLLSFVTQAERLPWREILHIFGETASSGTLDLSSLLATDSLQEDLKAGVCPVPLFDFDAEALELFARGEDIDEARKHLESLGIYQYFFPSRDQIALGLVDQGMTDGLSIARAGEAAPVLGHPYGRAELVGDADDFVCVLSALDEAGFVAEGEIGLEISPAGRTVRSTIKVQPREGLMAKLLNRFNVSLSPFDLMK